MTAQIGDSILFEDANYSIVCVSEKIDFNPNDYGIVPAQICTACWKGYFCTYSIKKDGIYLEDLYVNSKDNHYPVINGVKPLSEHGEGIGFVYMGHHLYKGLNIRIPYTGKILLGSDFMHEYYRHMGIQSPWSYKELTELVFKDGILFEKNDQSDIADIIRKRIAEIKTSDTLTEDESMYLYTDEEYYLAKACNIDVWWL